MNTNTTSVRPVEKYFCSTCNRQGWDIAAPTGWYAFSRSSTEGWDKLGLYCSLACLLEFVSTMERNERRAALLSKDV
jgi:hypothetical protein